jgi:hypothetical protein
MKDQFMSAADIVLVLVAFLLVLRVKGVTF